LRRYEPVLTGTLGRWRGQRRYDREMSTGAPVDRSPGQLVRYFRDAAKPTADELQRRARSSSNRADSALAVEQRDRARRRAGLTQEELVARCGLSVEGLRKIERDRVCPHPDTLRALARALQLSSAQYAVLVAAAERTRSQRDHNAATSPLPGALPVALTSLVGRQPDLAALMVLLRAAPTTHDPMARDCRLVTLTGVGGCGKTRLAIAAAAALQEDMKDGARLVELATLPATNTDTAAIEGAVAAAIGLRGSASRLSLGALIQQLHARNMLLVIDNCEHVLNPCRTIIAALLRACPEIVILATSREALGIIGETVWPVAPLITPGPGENTAAALAHYQSVTLFMERARARVPSLALIDANAPQVGRIVRQLDGLPLALELAAARLPALSLAQLVPRLDDRFTLLTRGNAAAAPRQQTLQATMDWSFHLLGKDAASLLGRLSAFAGGWTAEAALAVCGTNEVAGIALLDTLTQLVDRSLIQSRTADGGVTCRYQMLETVREYARIRLERGGEDGVLAVRRRHLAWCLTVVLPAGAEHQEAGACSEPEVLEEELDNLRAALLFGLGDGASVVPVLRLASALWPFWRRRGSAREGRRWLERALAMPAARMVQDPGVKIARITALDAAAHLARSQGADAQAARFLDEKHALMHPPGRHQSG
jgi:predicted ATPase/transcriptional regulator with XRE-family HTH domain